MEFLQDIKPTLVRHCDVEQYHITWLFSDGLHGLITVRGFRTHGHSAAFSNDAFQAFTYNSMIIDDDNVNHFSGAAISSRVPLPGPEKMLNSPPIRWTLSFIPTIPKDLRSLISCRVSP